jgi:histidinol phosphatase-like enzyme (inositol monophosphatase family)
MTRSPGTLLQAVAELARLAGDAAHELFQRRDVEIEIKSDGSPVTIADRRAEAVAREWIRKRFPQDGVLGEEMGLDRENARRRWIIDPIDGTKAFVRGVPLWGTLIAVAEGNDVLAGAAYFPAMNELVAAAPGEGCWWNDARARVSSTSTLDSATVLTTDDRFPDRLERRERWVALSGRAGVARTWGDCYGYLLVATGRAEVMVDDIVSPWDAAAFAPIIAEAGGVLTDWSGVATAFGGDLIATNAELAGEVRDILVGDRSGVGR